MPRQGTGDPLLNGSDWRALRAHWRALRLPCARCGHPIDYEDRTRGPRSLVVGHIVSRLEARSLGWTKAQINHVTNTQPECSTCSSSSGAADGNRHRTRAPRIPLEANEW